MSVTESDMEKASLLPGRWYVVMRADEENNFYINAYDTTEEYDENSDYIETGEILLNGMMELIESDFDRVVAAGLARISFLSEREAFIEEEESDDSSRPLIERSTDSNIVKITFGKKQ